MGRPYATSYKPVGTGHDVQTHISDADDEAVLGQFDAELPGSRSDPLVRVKPPAAVDGDLPLLLECPEFVVDLVIGKIQLFSEVFDCFRSLQ